jgi:hypothetical protein
VRLVGFGDLAIFLKEHIRDPRLSDFRAIGLDRAPADERDLHVGRMIALPLANLGQQRRARPAGWVGKE